MRRRAQAVVRAGADAGKVDRGAARGRGELDVVAHDVDDVVRAAVGQISNVRAASVAVHDDVANAQAVARAQVDRIVGNAHRPRKLRIEAVLGRLVDARAVANERGGVGVDGRYADAP